MRTSRRGVKIVALLAGGSLALTACTSGGSDDTGSGGGGGGGATEGPSNATITVAHEQEFGSYNNNTAEENAIKNTVVLDQVLRGFWNFGEDGSVVPDTEFGTYEQTSEDPLVVDYTFADGAVWSDGEPIDCDDAMLVWAANSGTYTTGKMTSENEPELLFSSAGTTGYELQEKPDCNDGDKEFTINYKEPFADWAAMYGTAFLPAHIVEQKAGGIDLVDAVKNDDKAALQKAADFYNSGWVFDPGQLDTSITPSSGPYMLDSWQAGQSITLKANPEYWGTQAKVGTVVIRFIEQEGQSLALSNNEIQIAEPQPNPDVLAQLEQLGDQVNVISGDEFTWEHLDYDFRGFFKDPALRKAFALCVPRKAIVDTLIKPVNPEAVVQDVRNVQPFQPSYDQVVSTGYDGNYDQADPAAAKAILEKAGAVGQTVRIGYQTPNQRRTNQVALIRDSCNQAGFDIQDAGQDDFFGNGLANGNFDVAMFAWAGSPLVSGWASTYQTGGGNNNGKYSNKQVDDLIRRLNVTPNPEDQTPLIGQIEKILWDDLATIPLFTFPGIVGHSSNITGVVFQPAQTQVEWNMDEWDVEQ